MFPCLYLSISIGRVEAIDECHKRWELLWLDLAWTLHEQIRYLQQGRDDGADRDRPRLSYYRSLGMDLCCVVPLNRHFLVCTCMGDCVRWNGWDFGIVFLDIYLNFVRNNYLQQVVFRKEWILLWSKLERNRLQLRFGKNIIVNKQMRRWMFECLHKLNSFYWLIYWARIGFRE